MTDSYLKLFEAVGVDFTKFIETGAENCLFLPHSKVASNWENIKKQVNDGIILVRGCGRHADSQDIANSAYGKLFCVKKIDVDKTNNANPGKYYTLFEKESGEKLYNYQVSHVFGRTKNPYAFMGLWNISLVPKLLDPLTGHESHGLYKNGFQKLFKKRSFDLYPDILEDFNAIMLNLNKKLDDWANDDPIVRSKREKGCKQRHLDLVIREIKNAFSGITPD